MRDHCSEGSTNNNNKTSPAFENTWLLQYQTTSEVHSLKYRIRWQSGEHHPPHHHFVAQIEPQCTELDTQCGHRCAQCGHNNPDTVQLGCDAQVSTKEPSFN